MKPIAVPSFQIGIWRSTSGTWDAGCSKRQRLADPHRRLVDLVQEQEVGNAALLEIAQHDLKRRDLLLVGFRDHDRCVDDSEAPARSHTRTRPSPGQSRNV